MRFWTSAVLILGLAIHARSVWAADDDIQVLFVGNSLTYVGNLPAVFDAVTRANGRHTSSSMIVAPGATLTDRVKDGAVERALSERKFSFLVLQERGGDFMCGFGPQVCDDSRRSLEALAAMARGHDAVPVLLGTYQGEHVASERIVAEESKAAGILGVRYVSVSDRLQRGRALEPDMEWLYADGMHPGRDLVLMEALLLYEELFHEAPAATGIIVEAPIYSVSSGLTPNLRTASDPAPRQGTPVGAQYDSDHVAQLKRVLR